MEHAVRIEMRRNAADAENEQGSRTEESQDPLECPASSPPRGNPEIAGLNYQRIYLGAMLSPARTSLLENLVDRLAGLPSIGRKSAQRLAHHILASPLEDVEALGQALIEARRGVRPCAVCGNHA